APITVTAVAIPSYQGPFVADPSFGLVTDKGANTYDPDTVYVTDGNSVFLTKNHGTNWVDRTTDLAGMGLIADLEVDPTNGDTVYAVRNGFGGGKVFLSTDAGQSWTDITFDLPDRPVWKLVLDPRTGNTYVGTDEGVYLLRSGTFNWQRFG